MKSWIRTVAIISIGTSLAILFATLLLIHSRMEAAQIERELAMATARANARRVMVLESYINDLRIMMAARGMSPPSVPPMEENDARDARP